MTEAFPATNRSPLLALVGGDLMLTVRIEAAARALETSIRPVNDMNDLTAALREHAPSGAVLDLAASAFSVREAVSAVHDSRAPAPLVLGFFPHVMKDLGARARAAGCDVVVPRSRFMNDMPSLLKLLVGGSPAELVAIAGNDDDS